MKAMYSDGVDELSWTGKRMAYFVRDWGSRDILANVVGDPYSNTTCVAFFLEVCF